MGDRFSIDKLGYNERNVYFDVNQFDDLELDDFVAYYNDLLYQQARYYLRYQQYIQDQHKQEYELYVWLPSYFSGGFNLFGYKLSSLHALTSIRLDGNDVDLIDGLHQIQVGKHELLLPPNSACLDMFNNLVFDGVNHIIYNDSQESKTVSFYQPQDQLIYVFEQGGELTITLPWQYYVLNYKYKFIGVDTVIYQRNFVEPIVQMRLLKGVNP